MTVYYADSSVLIKRYVPEQGTAWVRALADEASENPITSAFITQIEGISAFNRRVRDGTLDAAEYSRIIEDWTVNCATT